MTAATATKPTTTETTLHEYAASKTAMRVDRANHVIRGVKIIGFESVNGRSYSKAALQQAIGLYEGIKVNVNHPPRGLESAPRSYADRLGVLRNVKLEKDGLRGDLHYNPKHPLAEQLLWDAENAPENVGLSHNAVGRTVQRDGKTVIEEIVRVNSVDLVADPATTRGLFEGTAAPLADVGLLDVQQFRPDLIEEASQKRLKALETEQAALREEQQRLKAALALREQLEKIDAELRQAGLNPADPVQVSKPFMEQLVAADDARRKALIEDRRALLAPVARQGVRIDFRGRVRPTSTGPAPHGSNSKVRTLREAVVSWGGKGGPVRELTDAVRSWRRR